MPNSTEGTGAIDASGTGPITELPNTHLENFVTGAKSISEIINLAHSAVTSHESFEKRMAAIEAGHETELARVRDSVGNLKSLDPAHRKAVIDEEMSTFRRWQREASHTERYKDLAKMKQAHDMVISVQSIYETPSRILAPYGFGSELRSRYREQMENSGPTELQVFAALAVSKNNKVMGAALFAHLDGMSPKERAQTGLKRDKIAKILVGEEHAKVQEAITIVKNRLERAINRNRSFEKGKTVGKIGDALRSLGETGILNADEGE